MIIIIFSEQETEDVWNKRKLTPLRRDTGKLILQSITRGTLSIPISAGRHPRRSLRFPFVTFIRKYAPRWQSEGGRKEIRFSGFLVSIIIGSPPRHLNQSNADGELHLQVLLLSLLHLPLFFGETLRGSVWRILWKRTWKTIKASAITQCTSYIHETNRDRLKSNQKLRRRKSTLNKWNPRSESIRTTK